MRFDLLADTTFAAPELPCGVFICDADTRLRAANTRFLDWLGIDERAAQQCLLIERLQPEATASHDVNGRRPGWRHAMQAGRPHMGEYHYRRPDGRALSVQQSIAPLPDGTFLGIALAIETAGARGNAWYAAHHDAASGLPNQILLEERLDVRLGVLRPRQGVLCAYVIHIHDRGRMRRSGGVPAWTAGLQIEATRLRTLAGNHGIVARLGGGEFFLAFAEADAPAVPQLLAVLTEPLRVGEHVIQPEVAIGTYRHLAADLGHGSDVVHRASLAAADALAAGGSCARPYSRRLQEALNDRWELSRDLTRAIQNRQLHVVFQPELDLDTFKPVSMETLVRWQCPQRGLVSPAVFVPLAEEAGLIGELGAWVLEQACRFARQLDARYRDAPKVAVNVSPLQLRDGDFVTLVDDVLTRTGLAPDRLELEITEGILVDDDLDVASMLDRLKALGVNLAIDDFGTGYSSLAYLARFPLSRLKIDRTFVKDLPDDTKALAIVKAILGLAHGLGMQVTAEGIEHDAQAQLLRDLGCQLGQGFGLVKPLPADGIKALLTLRYAD